MTICTCVVCVCTVCACTGARVLMFFHGVCVGGWGVCVLECWYVSVCCKWVVCVCVYSCLCMRAYVHVLLWCVLHVCVCWDVYAFLLRVGGVSMFVCVEYVRVGSVK